VLILKLAFCAFCAFSGLTLLFLVSWLRLMSANRGITPAPPAMLIEFPSTPIVREARLEVRRRRSYHGQQP
jgi:hypothetical protein